MNIQELDLENVEAILQAEDKKKNKKSDDERGKKRSKRRGSLSRSHSRHQKKKKNRSRSKSSKSKERKRKEKEQEKIQKKIQKQQEELERKQQEMLEQKNRELQKQAEEAQRDANTVLVLQLSYKTDEKSLYSYFKQCGKVRDIKLIRDQKTNRCKGIAYVEFYSQDSVLKGLSLSGSILDGNKILVQPSQAEKNRAHVNSKTLKQQYSSNEVQMSNKAYIRGLVGQLADITESDLRELFNPFGEIEFIDLRRDPISHKSLGFAFIQYKDWKSAQHSIQTMNGFEINGQQIVVSSNPMGPLNFLPSIQSQQVPQSFEKDLDYDEGSAYLHSASSKFLLMQKLTRQGQEKLEGKKEEKKETLSQEQIKPVVPQIPIPQVVVPAANIDEIGGKINQDANIFVKNLDPNLTIEQLEGVFSIYGTILSTKIACDSFGKSYGYGYVQYQDVSSANKAILQANGTELKGKILEVKPFVAKQARMDPKNNIYVKNLPALSEQVLEEKLRDIFQQFGYITSLKVQFEKSIGRPYAFICFEDHASAELAISKLYGQNPFGIEQGLYISWAEKKTDRLQKLVSQYSSDLLNSVLGGTTQGQPPLQVPVQQQQAPFELQAQPYQQVQQQQNYQFN